MKRSAMFFLCEGMLGSIPWSVAFAAPPQPLPAPTDADASMMTPSVFEATFNAAMGRAPAPGGAGAGAEEQFDPMTTADPGYTERRFDQPATQTYGSTATSVDPDGNQVQGLRLYDSSLNPVETGYLDATPEFHVVQPGDTLWDISGYYLTDPYLWPKLWSWNEHLTNPHWVFPGDRIRLSDPTEEVSGPVAELGTPLGQRDLPSRVKQDTYMLNQFAFVDRQQFETSMKVVGGSDANVMMSTLDVTYMSYDRANPPIPGERVIVYAPTEEVYDLKGKVIGYVVQIIGEVEVDAVAREAAEGTIVNALNPVERGYRVGPLRRVFRRVDAVDANRSSNGHVVATLTTTGPMPFKSKRFGPQRDYYTLAGEEVFVVVDMGSDDGVQVGHTLEVVRKGDGYTRKRVFALPYEEGWPRRIVGALLVVDVQPETALAVTLYARVEFEKGDHVELRGHGLEHRTTTSVSLSEGERIDRNVRADTDDGSVKAQAGFEVED